MTQIVSRLTQQCVKSMQKDVKICDRPAVLFLRGWPALASDGSLCARSIPPLARESLLCALGGEVKCCCLFFYSSLIIGFRFGVLTGRLWDICMGVQGMAVAAKKEDWACSARQVNFHAEQIRFRLLLAVGEAII